MVSGLDEALRQAQAGQAIRMIEDVKPRWLTTAALTARAGRDAYAVAQA